jgi:hypothetical protein
MSTTPTAASESSRRSTVKPTRQKAPATAATPTAESEPSQQQAPTPTPSTTTYTPGQRLAVFTIRERQGGYSPNWVRIGTAFVNRDLSLSLVLDALPLDGKLHVRAATEKAEGKAQQLRAVAAS